MTRRRLAAAAIGIFLMFAAIAAGVLLRASPRAEKPVLLLLTSLPLALPEEFTLDAKPSPAVTALQSQYRVRPISVTDASSLAGGGVLLMAQPRAQPGEMLVSLDEWVRRGGRVLLLADPMLEWPSSRALGDPTRPPPAFADTGLLGHWGLRLDAADKRGPASFEVDGRPAHALSAGRLVATGDDCAIAADGFIARCRVGGGRATVIADADFIDVDRRREPARSGNLDVLIAELDRLRD